MRILVFLFMGALFSAPAHAGWVHQQGRVGDESLLYLLHLSRQELPENGFDASVCHPPSDRTPADPSTFSEWIPASSWRTVQKLTLHGQPVAQIDYFERLYAEGETPLKAYLVTIHNGRNDFAFPPLMPRPPKGVAPLTELVQSQPGALVAINGGYFNHASLSFAGDQGQVLSFPISAIAREHKDESGQKVSSYYNAIRAAFRSHSTGGFGMGWVCPVASEDGPQLVGLSQPLPHAHGGPPIPLEEFLTSGQPWKFESGIGGGPMLVYDSQERITLEEELFWGSGDITPQKRQPRTAIGYSGTTLYMLVVDGRAGSLSCGLTLKEVALTMQDLGAEYAMNLDGGGSSTLWLSKEWLVDQDRMPTAGFVLNRPSNKGQERAIGSGMAARPRHR